jgi:hypothetical protein
MTTTKIILRKIISPRGNLCATFEKSYQHDRLSVAHATRSVTSKNFVCAFTAKRAEDRESLEKLFGRSGSGKNEAAYPG